MWVPREKKMALLDWPSQHIRRPGRVSLSGEKLPSAPRCCPASGSGASSAPEASSPWPPHFLWKRLGWWYHPSFPVPPTPPPFLRSPSLSLNFLMATSSLVSCKDTRMHHECKVRGEKRKKKSEPKAHWEHQKERERERMVCGSCRTNRQNNARLVLFMHCTRMQKAYSILGTAHVPSSSFQFVDWSRGKNEVLAETLLRFRLLTLMHRCFSDLMVGSDGEARLGQGKWAFYNFHQSPTCMTTQKHILAKP